MCGIAGFSLDRDSGVDRTLAAQALLAGIAERGADAVGYAYRSREPEVSIHKQRSGATALLDAVSLPRDAAEALVHVRDYTKGHPTLAREQPPDPPRVGSGHPQRDHRERRGDSRTARHLRARSPGMTVDSEAIFALMHRTRSRPQRARGAARLDGDGLDRRARSGKGCTSPAGSPDRSGSARARSGGLLRLDEGRPRGRRGFAAA